MSFVSVEFVVLLTIVLALLAIVRSHTLAKVIIFSASCVFYAYWDWRFLGLILFMTVLDFTLASRMAVTQSHRTRRILLTISVVANLSLLAVFKYFNFFIDTFNVFLSPTGSELSTLSIILPIGISFYTFETLSYVIDVYRGDTKPTQSLLDYAVFVTFFPRLVAGPIMRASNFLPQLQHKIEIRKDNLFLGLQIFLRGLFLKLVIADNLAIIVDQVYATPRVLSSSTVWLGVLAYSIQILCDFSGYTDMAIGVARMMGFQLPQNFNLPYTAQSISEFWERWHISLSTWLRDYLYISLGGNRKGQIRTYVNLMITMLLGGLWHGASWNFVFWGGLHGSYMILERVARGGQRPTAGPWNRAATWLRASAVFLLVSVTWVFFRSPSLDTTLAVFQKLLFLDSSGFAWISLAALMTVVAFVIGGFLVRRFNYRMPVLSLDKSYAPAIILGEILAVYFLSPLSTSPFIYFQF